MARLIDQLAAATRVRWVASSNLHLTLKFLGDVERVEVPRVCAAVQAAATKLALLRDRTRLWRWRDFQWRKSALLIWLGVGQGSEAMIALHDLIDEGLCPLGFRGEGRRAFRPHLTLGRVRDAQEGRTDLIELLRHHENFSAGTTHVDEAVVFASELRSEGAQYERLASATLGDS